jgi:hypothetical protein
VIDAYLAEVELSIFLCCDALDLDEGGVGAGVTLGALVAEDTSLRVESVRRKDEHGLDLSPGTTSSRLHAAHPSHSNESIEFVYQRDMQRRHRNTMGCGTDLVEPIFTV